MPWNLFYPTNCLKTKAVQFPIIKDKENQQLLKFEMLNQWNLGILAENNFIQCLIE